MRQALHKTPTLHQLETLGLQVSQRKFERAMAVVARQLGTNFDGDVLLLPPTLRQDDTYPAALRILYRKMGFDCGAPGSTDGGCLSFDVIPMGVRGDPRRYKTYRSFKGGLEEGEELFQELLRFLHHVVRAVNQHQR